MKIKRLWPWLRLTQKQVENDDLVLKALADYVLNIDLKKITAENPDDAILYSKDKYELLRRDIEYLDEKADAAIRYLGLGTGGLGAFLGYSLIKMGPGFIPKIFLLIGVVFWIAALIHAMFVRSPSITYYSPSIRKLMNFSENVTLLTGMHIPMKTMLMQYYEKINVYLWYTENWKASRVNLVYLYISISLILFGLGWALHFIRI